MRWRRPLSSETAMSGTIKKRVTRALKRARAKSDTQEIKMRIGECDLYISDGYGERAYESTYSWFYWIEVTAQSYSGEKTFAVYERYEREDGSSVQLEWLNDEDIEHIARVAVDAIAAANYKKGIHR